MTPYLVLGVHGNLEPKTAQIIAPLVVPWTDGLVVPFDFSQEQQAGSLISHMSTLSWSHLYVSGLLTTRFSVQFSSGQRIGFNTLAELEGNVPVIQANPIRFVVTVANPDGAVGQTFLGMTNMYPRRVSFV